MFVLFGFVIIAVSCVGSTCWLTEFTIVKLVQYQLSSLYNFKCSLYNYMNV